MTGRVKVIKRRSVSTGQMVRERTPASPPEVSPSVAAVAVAESAPAPAPSPQEEPPGSPPEAASRVEVTRVGPESMELRVRCACGCETLIELNHPAEGVA